MCLKINQDRRNQDADDVNEKEKKDKERPEGGDTVQIIEKRRRGHYLSVLLAGLACRRPDS
jgi:hypothetical protein